MNITTWNHLEREFTEFPNLKAEPVSDGELEELEASLGFPLPLEYSEFVKRYGGAIVGAYRIYGLRRAAAMGRKEGSVLETTNRFRKQNWPGTEHWLVFSIDLSGNPIGLDAEGRVWISDHDNGDISVVTQTFEEFILKHCLRR